MANPANVAGAQPPAAAAAAQAAPNPQAPPPVNPIDLLAQQLAQFKLAQDLANVRQSQALNQERLDRRNQQQMAAVQAQNQDIINARHGQAIARLEGRNWQIIKDVSVAGGKIIVKAGAKEAVFQAGKFISLEAAKKASAVTAGKIIPVVSVIVGLGLAIFRIVKGVKTGDKTQFFKAAGEVGSGVLACFPGWGTGASILLDAGMAGHDVYTNLYPSNFPAPAQNLQQNPLPAAEMTLDEAYQGLGLQQNAAKDVVDTAYRQLTMALHPDRHPVGSIEDYGILQHFLAQCRDKIYAAQRWA